MDPAPTTEPGFWTVFRARALHLGSMSRRLRLVTALAIAQVLAAAILLALRGLHLSTTPLVGGSQGLTSVPLLVLWLSAGFLTLAWAYLLAGTAHAHLAVRIGGLAAFGASLIPIGQAVGWNGTPAVVRVVLLVALAAATLLLGRRRRADSRHDGGFEPLRLLVFFALIGGIYATYAWDASSYTVFRLFTAGFADGLLSLSFFLIPVLFLTGAEFSEWAQVVGDRGAATTERIGSVPLLAGVAAAISIAVLIHDFAGTSYGSQIPTQIVLFALGASLVVLVARRARPQAGWPRALPWVALALTSFAFIAILLVEVYRTTSLAPERLAAADRTVAGPLRTYVHTTSPQFTMRIPENWEVLKFLSGDATKVSTLTGFSGHSTADPADLFVSTAPDRLLLGSNQLLPIFLHHFYANLHPHLATGRPAVGGWRETQFTLGPKLHGIAWERTIGKLRWALVAYSNRAVFSLNQPAFRFMWQSFTAHAVATAPAQPAARAQPDPYAYDPVVIVPFLVWLVIAAAAAALLTQLRRRASPSLQLGFLFLFAFAVLYLLSQLRRVLEQLFHGPLGPLYSVRLPGIQAAVAIATLVTLAWMLLARRSRAKPVAATLRGLVMLGAGLQVLLWIAQLYQSAKQVGARLSIAQGLVILLALLWELAVSGEAITNGDSAWLPRASRVLVFCGYIMLVATTVLFFSALRLQATGAAVLPEFESEGWPALGILQLGVPALLCLAALQLRLFDRADERPGVSG